MEDRLFGHAVELPERGFLMHIGPHKTGTSALQGALEITRDELRTFGIRYVAPRRTPLRAAVVSQTSGPRAMRYNQGLKLWPALVNKVNSITDERVMLSSEFFCEAAPLTAARIVSEFGGERVHVVATLRPLTEILPSQWQQFVRSGMRQPYDRWLDTVLNKPRDAEPLTNFWRRHDQGALIERWVETVGAGNLAGVVVDETDRRALYRGFEQLLRLEDGYLVPKPGVVNRSLSLGEIEAVRVVNEEFKARGWTPRQYDRLIREGMIAAIRRGRTPGPDEERISTPAWALERASEIGAESAKRIEATGIPVLGDLSKLAAMPSNLSEVRSDSAPLSTSVPAEVVAHAVRGVILASGYTEPADQRPAPGADQLPTRQLFDTLRNRASRRAGRMAQRLRSRS
jgi:hypothetical protein